MKKDWGDKARGLRNRKKRKKPSEMQEKILKIGRLCGIAWIWVYTVLHLAIRWFYHGFIRFLARVYL